MDKETEDFEIQHRPGIGAALDLLKDELVSTQKLSCFGFTTTFNIFI